MPRPGRPPRLRGSPSFSQPHFPCVDRSPFTYLTLHNLHISSSKMTQTLHSSTHFLQRGPLYETEKPYSLRFTPPEGFPRANINLERHDIAFHDIRDRKSKLDFRRDGYTILDFESKMTYEDYDDDEVVKEVLLREIANELKEFLGARHV